MEFQLHNGHIIPGAPIEKVKERLGFCGREYVVCFTCDNKLYVTLGDEDLNIARKKAYKFSNRNEIELKIYYIERVTCDKVTQKFIENIKPRLKPCTILNDKISNTECYNIVHADNKENLSKTDNNIEDKSITDKCNEYFNYINYKH